MARARVFESNVGVSSGADHVVGYLQDFSAGQILKAGANLERIAQQLFERERAASQCRKTIGFEPATPTSRTVWRRASLLLDAPTGADLS